MILLIKKTFSQRNLFIQIISFSMIILMFYAGTTKLLDVSLFQSQMSKSPLIPETLIPFISYALPIFEIGIAFMLFNKKTIKLGLLISFSVMLMFTLYLIFLTSLYENLPCSCGGILGKMSYTTHIIFNISFTILAWIGFYLANLTELNDNI